MTIQSRISWWRSCLPVARSWPYFLPAWLVFGYLFFAPSGWPQSCAPLLYVIACTFAQVSHFTMRVTYWQWLVAAVLLPIFVVMLLAQVVRLFIPVA